jgi:transketolase
MISVGMGTPMPGMRGVNTFGNSAPYKVLDEKFGFTAENVYRQVRDHLAKNKRETL